MLPCEAASWSYLLGKRCGNQHSNPYPPVVTYRTIDCVLLVFLFALVLNCLPEDGKTIVCHVHDSPQFNASQCFLFIPVFLGMFHFSHKCFSFSSSKSISACTSLSLPLIIVIMLLTDGIPKLMAPVCQSVPMICTV